MAKSKLPRDIDMPADEITQVTDQRSMYKKLEKLDGVLQQIKVTLSSYNDSLIELNTTMITIDGRVDRVEKYVDKGHDCYQVDMISNVYEGNKQIAATMNDYLGSSIKVEEKIKHIEHDVGVIKGNRKWLVGVIITLLVPILGSIGSAIWLAATLNTKVEAQEEIRRQQLDRVENSIRVSNKRQTDALKVIDLQLEKTVVVSETKSPGIISQKVGKHVP
jgi:hypothetical protein